MTSAQVSPIGAIADVIRMIGQAAAAALHALLRGPGATACFLRRLYSVNELSEQFGVPVAQLLQVNPALIGYPLVGGSQVIVLPGRHRGPRDAFRSKDFVLLPIEMPPHVFLASSWKDEMREKGWYPPAPPFQQADREATFGRFEYVDAPTGDDADAINITGDWERNNIGSVHLPQIVGVRRGAWKKNLSFKGNDSFYKKAIPQLKGLFEAWQRAGVIGQIKTWNGAFVPRYMRQAAHIRRNLSNHSWGTAFDINAEWNKLKHPAAGLGKQGCVLELVEIAYEYGFFWGGHFGGGRTDGMHFEVAKIL